MVGPKRQGEVRRHLVSELLITDRGYVVRRTQNPMSVKSADRRVALLRHRRVGRSG